MYAKLHHILPTPCNMIWTDMRCFWGAFLFQFWKSRVNNLLSVFFCLGCFMLYINARLKHTPINGHLINIVLSFFTALRHGQHQASECVLWNRDMSSTTPATSAWSSFRCLTEGFGGRELLPTVHPGPMWPPGMWCTHTWPSIHPLHHINSEDKIFFPGLISVIHCQWSEWMTHFLCLPVMKCHGLCNIYVV